MNDYQWYKAHHICVRCHHHEAVNGKVTCLDCRDKEREVDRERKRKKLAGETPEHKAERLRKMKERRERLKEQNVCVYCGQRKALEGKQHCLECYVKQRRANVKSKRRRRAYDKSRSLSGANRSGVGAKMRIGTGRGGRWS